MFLLVMLYKSDLYVLDIHMIQMVYALAYIFIMNIINAIISMINNFFYVIIMRLIYEIKMIWKLPNYLTIQKPNYKHFSVRGFTAVLKLDPFDGKNFLIWKAKME
jgi:hypothetical protein